MCCTGCCWAVATVLGTAPGRSCVITPYPTWCSTLPFQASNPPPPCTQAKRVGANLTQTATVSANWLREMSARVMAQMTQHEEDAVDDSPRLYETFGSSSSSAIGLSMQSMPPPAPSGSSVVGPGGNDSGVDLSTQSEPVGLGGRIAGRLRALAPSGTGTGDAGSNGLPASTAAAAGPGGFEGGGRSFAASASSGSSSGLAALKQKWQELEASAGDGTKQFLVRLACTPIRYSHVHMARWGGLLAFTWRRNWPRMRITSA